MNDKDVQAAHAAQAVPGQAGMERANLPGGCF